MKKILLLGASGSIGQKTLDVVSQHSEMYTVRGVSVGHNVPFLQEYLEEHPETKYAYSIEEQPDLKALYPAVTFFHGADGLSEMASIEEFDLVVNSLQGFVGLRPTLCAIEHHMDVAIANKEPLVSAGSLVTRMARENGVRILPIDSEHSAIFQCMLGNNKDAIRRLIITASGGSFRELPRQQLEDVTVEQALAHPNWNMGNKITIDSATMMNKGFEVIEAHWLFDIPYEKIDVVLHRESVIHSLVEFVDHSIMAQLGVSDMRVPIQYALSYPDRLANNVASLDLEKLTELHFEFMSFERFPLLACAYEVGNKGGNLSAIMNGANEKAVQLFLDRKISFLDIERLIIGCLAQAEYINDPDLEQVIASDCWAQQWVEDHFEEI